LEVSRLLEEFQRAYGHLTERPEDRLEVCPPAEPVTLLADRQLLKQVLVNLTENAVAAVRESGRPETRVRVWARRSPRASDRLEIRVEDNGPGVEHQRRETVFEPYQTTRQQGTGLGLAIVKKIVLDHGGEIHIEESELGGAAFVVQLPVVPGEAGRPAAS
jgi:signal transduction histidine kinase